MKKLYNLMGKIITVRTILHPRRVVELVPGGKHERVVNQESLASPRAGWVVGFGCLKEGKIKGGRVYGESDYESPYLEVTKVIPCIYVKFWPTRQQVAVPRDGWTLGGTPVDIEHKWTEGWKSKFKLAKDSKGRFTGDTVSL